MANFYVTHHRFPSNPQLFTVALYKAAGKGVDEGNPNFKPRFRVAEPTWKLFIYTSGLDASGDSVGPVIADVVGTLETVNEVVEEKLAELCGLIDWSQQGEYSAEVDRNAPIIFERFPVAGQVDVPITSPVVIRVKEPLPGEGIDVSSVVMEIDGFTINPSVTGNKYDYTFVFSPRPILDS